MKVREKQDQKDRVRKRGLKREKHTERVKKKVRESRLERTGKRRLQSES